MRLDLFLKASRIVLRRSVARQLCDAGAIKVNGVISKASKEIKSGDEIEIKRGPRTLRLRVIDLPASKQVSRSDAASLVEVISDIKEPDPQLP